METQTRPRKEESETTVRRENRPRNLGGMDGGGRVRLDEAGYGFPQASFGAYGIQPGQGGFAQSGYGQYGPWAGPFPQATPFIGSPVTNPFTAIAPTLSYGLAGVADLVQRGVALATAQGQMVLNAVQAPFIGGRANLPNPQGQVAWPNARVPYIDLVDEGNELVCQVELPGVKPESVDLACHGRGLLVTAQAEPEIDLGALVQAERGLQTTFRRSIPLPTTIQPSGAKARLRDGILTVNLPKADPTEGPRRVPVE